MEGDHTRYNEGCPQNDPGEYSSNPALAGIEPDCTCRADGFRDDNEVGSLSGQALLDALSEAWNNKHYKGWTFREMVHGPSVLPMTVYDEGDRITKYEAIGMTQMDKGRIVGLTLMVTTSEGTRFEDFIPARKP